MLTASYSASSNNSPTDFKGKSSLGPATSGAYARSPTLPPQPSSAPKLLFTLKGANSFVLTCVHSLKHFSIFSLWTAHFSNALKPPKG